MSVLRYEFATSFRPQTQHPGGPIQIPRRWADGYFEATAGAFANEPFSRADQGTLPHRGHW